MRARSVFRYSFYPLLVGGSLAIYFYFARRSSIATLSTLSAIIALVSIATIHVCEKWMPYRRSWNISAGDRATNLLLTNVVLPMGFKAVEIGLSLAIASLLSEVVREKLHGLWPAHWGLTAQLALALLLCEFFFYWIHRWGHTSPQLWKFHSIHHAVKRVYWNNSGRFHPVDMILNLTFYLAPLVLLGVPPIIVGAFATVNAVTGLLEHANVDYKAGPFNFIFNTAELHRWHHSTDPVVSSKNFGKALCIWDLVFKSWYLPKDKEVGEVGVTTELIPEDLLGQIVHPFKKIS